MKIFCYIPEVCLTDTEASSQVRRQLTIAIAEKIEPVGLPRSTRSIVVDLDDGHLKHVTDMGKALNLAPGRVVGGLLYGLHLAGSQSATSHEPVPNLSDLRPGQIRCLQEAAPLLRGGKIVLSECGTGSGKGRLIAHAAAYVLALRDAKLLPDVQRIDLLTNNDGDQPSFIRKHAADAQDIREARMAEQGLKQPRAVIISAPSIENVVHLTREWSQVQAKVDPKKLLSLALILGRGQFVSESHLAFMLEESENEYPAIHEWLEQGMPAGLTASTKNLKKIEPRLHGLMADLEFLANQCDFAHQDAGLDEDSSLQEQSLYKELREKAMTADIVFTTHAMLCLDNMQLMSSTAPGLLPYAAAVFVDEAHTLESVQSSIAAKSLSFVRLLSVLSMKEWGSLRKETAAKTASASARKALELLKDVPDETPLPIETCFDNSAVKAWYAAQPALKQLTDDLKAITDGLDKKVKSQRTVRQQRSLRYIQSSLAALQNINNGYKGFIGHTPVRGHVTFTIGPSSVDKYLVARWATTPSAMLLSGTLMYIGANGAGPTATLSELAIPPIRGACTVPIHPAWLVDTPVLMMPATDQFHRLVPPTGQSINDLSLSAWLYECAKVVNLAATDAKGGMLVLMTGYDRLDGMVKALNEGFPQLSDRIIVQSRQQRVGSCSALFKSMARAGVRPIWIATGAAWTGLDLADETVPDKQAARDMLLTDLVIPNLPYGLDKTATHMARVARSGFVVEKMAVQRRFRQALGRLVRREGLKDRRIWILDGRLQHPSASNYTADLRRVLMAYVQRRPFNF